MHIGGTRRWDDARDWLAAEATRLAPDPDPATSAPAADLVAAPAPGSDLAAGSAPEPAADLATAPAPASDSVAGPTAEPVVARVGRAERAVRAALVDGGATAAVAELEPLAAADPGLREHLCVALAARATEAQGVTRDGNMVIVNRRQLRECQVLAERVLELEPRDPRMVDFATGLRDRVTAGRRWVWVPPRSRGTAALAAAVPLALPVLTIATGELSVVVLGALVGAGVVAALVVGHRKQRWVVDGRAVAPYVWRPGR